MAENAQRLHQQAFVDEGAGGWVEMDHQRRQARAMMRRAEASVG